MKCIYSRLDTGSNPIMTCHQVVCLSMMHLLPIVLFKTQFIIAVVLSQHDWGIVDWDIKPQNKQTSLWIFKLITQS